MSITYTARMIVGVDYNDLSQELKELGEDIYDFAENNGLTVCFSWYDCGLEGLIIGKEIDNCVSEEDLGSWLVTVKEAFEKVKTILKLDEVKLIASSDVY